MRLPLPRRAREQAQQEGRARSIGLLRLIVVVLALAWLLRALVVAPFSIPSGSMLPSLWAGDYLVAAKWPYGYSRYSFPWEFPPLDGRLLANLPERGDVVVFRGPGSDTDFIKRVVGLPGDRVELRNGLVVLNGQPLPQRPAGKVVVPVSRNSPCRRLRGRSASLPGPAGACVYRAFAERLPDGRWHPILDQVENGPADDMAPIVVPEGHLFLMGDNRDDSLDSRFSVAEGGIGLVPLENLIGRAGPIFWSTDGSAEYWKPWTWFSALRGDRLGKNASGGQ